MSKHIKFKLLSLYLDKRVGRQERESIENHLSTCQVCKDRLSSLEVTDQLAKKMPRLTESDGFDFEFRQKLNAKIAQQDKGISSQERLQNVLDRLRVPLARPVPVLVRATVLVTITALLTVSVMWNQASVMPAIASVQGRVEVYNTESKQTQTAREGMRLKIHDVIRVARNSQVNIESKRYEILLKEDTEVQPVQLERAFGRSKDIAYKLDRGKMLVATKKDFEGARLEIESPTAEIKVKGTGFMVKSLPVQQNMTWVGVLDGVVEVKSKIEVAGLPSRVLVEEGKATEVFPGSVPSTPRYLLKNEWEEVQEIYRIAEQPQVALLISMTPERVNELFRPAGLYISDKEAKAVSKAIIGVITRINEAIAKGDKQGHMDAIYRLETLIKKHPDPRYNVQFLFFIAGYYHYLKEYHKSISALERIIQEYPESKLVSLAFCAKGLIYEKKLKNPNNAALAYKAVLTKYPHSLEVQEATAGLRRIESQ